MLKENKIIIQIFETEIQNACENLDFSFQDSLDTFGDKIVFGNTANLEEFVKNIRNLPILENVTIIELDAAKMTGSYVDSLFAENNLDFLSKQKRLFLVRNFEDRVARISTTHLRSGYAHDWSQGSEKYLHNLDSSDRQKPWKYFCNLPF